jgi:hypothetical protein
MFKMYLFPSPFPVPFDDEIDMVVTLRMNRDFMKHMRLNYPEVIKNTHPRYSTIVSAQDLHDQNTKNNEDDEDLY